MGFFFKSKKPKLVKHKRRAVPDDSPYCITKVEVMGEPVPLKSTVVEDKPEKELITSKEEHAAPTKVPHNGEVIAKEGGGMNGVSRLSFDTLEEMAVHDDPLVLANIGLYKRCCEQLLTPNRIHISDPTLDAQFKSKVYPEHRSNFQRSFKSIAPMHIGMFGNALTELVYNKDGLVIDFITTDIRNFDFIGVDTTGYVTEVNGLPKGFKYSTYVPNTDRSMEFLYNKDLIHSYYLLLHNLEWAWGFVELLETYMNSKKNLNEAKDQKDSRLGYPFPLIKYGSRDFPPTPRMKEEAKKIAKSISNKNTVGEFYPGTMEIDFMDNKIPTEVSKSMTDDEYVICNMEAAIMGIPLPLFLMSMKDQPSTSLQNLIEFFEINFISFLKGLQIERAIYAWCKSMNEKFDGDVYIDYKEILSSTSKERIMQIFRMAKSDILFGPDQEENEKIRKKILDKVGLGNDTEYVDKVTDLTHKLKKME